MKLFDLFRCGKPRSLRDGQKQPSENVKERARSLRELGRYDEAIELLLSVVKSDPSVLSLLGNTYKKSGQCDEARKWFTRGLELSKKQGLEYNFAARMVGAESLANLGELEWEQGNHSGSLEYLEKAAKLMETAISECGIPDAEKEPFTVMAEMSLAVSTLSLAKKHFNLYHFGHACLWAQRHLDYVPECSEAQTIASIGAKFLPRAGAGDKVKNISVLLGWRHALSAHAFHEAVLPYFESLNERILEKYETSIDDLTFTLGNNQLLVSANAKDKQRCGEIAWFILQTWIEVTDGRGC